MPWQISQSLYLQSRKTHRTYLLFQGKLGKVSGEHTMVYFRECLECSFLKWMGGKLVIQWSRVSTPDQAEHVSIPVTLKLTSQYFYKCGQEIL